MAQLKPGKVLRPIRVPDEVNSWLERRAEYIGATVSAVVVNAVRTQMEAEAGAKARADRAGAVE
jgi:hypothetical protein